MLTNALNIVTNIACHWHTVVLFFSKYRKEKYVPVCNNNCNQGCKNYAFSSLLLYGGASVFSPSTG